MKELSLQEIFNNNLFKIPDYQRGYAWREKQLEEFYEDLIYLNTNRKHYAGVISIKKVTREVWNIWNQEKWLIEQRNYEPYHVVDGQQRLTTSIIFIQVLYELIKNIDENKNKSDLDIHFASFSLDDIKKKYLVIVRPSELKTNSYIFSYEEDNPSSEYLRHKILLENSKEVCEESIYTINMKNAKTFFEKNLLILYKNEGLKSLEELFKKLTQKFVFNLYSINDDFDVNVAFETMNNRGKKLSNLELLKNRLIYLTTLYEESNVSEDERIELRNIINSSWKKIYETLGKNKELKDSPEDIFLRDHWAMYFTYKREKGEEYIRFLLDKFFNPKRITTKSVIENVEIEEDFSEEIPDVIDEEENNSEKNKDVNIKDYLSPNEIKKYADSLRNSVQYWNLTWNPKSSSEISYEEKKWLDKLKRIGILYFRPLIMASYLNENSNKEERIKLFKAIERFIFINFRLGRALSTYRNSDFYGKARDLFKREITIDEITKNSLNEELDERMANWLFEKIDGQSFLKHDNFKTHLNKLFANYGGYYSWNGLKYFSYEYELSKYENEGRDLKIDWELFVRPERKDKVSIEHIFPQTPNLDEWESFKIISEDDLKFFQGSLGNLVPLSQSINSSLQNDSFENKKKAKLDDKGNKIREGYDNGSHSEIEVSKYNDWTPSTIEERGLKLLSFMEKRWDFKFKDEEVKKEILFLKFNQEDSQND